MDMMVDKMHYRNHVDSWCKANCNPYDRSNLDGASSHLLGDTFLHPKTPSMYCPDTHSFIYLYWVALI